MLSSGDAFVAAQQPIVGLTSRTRTESAGNGSRIYMFVDAGEYDMLYSTRCLNLREVFNIRGD